MARRFGQFTILNGVVATVVACVIWATAGLWLLIPLFVVLGAVVVALGREIVRRAG
jgi:uncharacterized membrane protein